jgi:hypothetical protein
VREVASLFFRLGQLWPQSTVDGYTMVCSSSFKPTIDMDLQATECTCEPSNARLCCDHVACCPYRGQSRNGNKILDVRSEPGPPPRLNVGISHMAGLLCDYFIPESLCDCISMPFFVFVLSTCFPVSTSLSLRKQGPGVDGVVIRRSGCCTWRVPIEGDASIRVALDEVTDDTEASPHLFLHTGAEKVEVATGTVEGLEELVHTWLRPTQ